MQRATDDGKTDGHDDRPEDFVQSVGRALRLLEVVGASPGLPVKAIARRSDLNISTTYHLVRTMAYEGYLLRLPDGTYAIGDQVARRFHDLLGAFEKPPAASAVLRHLAERTGLSAYLGCFDSARVTVVDVVEGPGSPYLEDFEVGLDVSAHATALGKALLASLTRRERRSYLREAGLRPFTANTCTDMTALETQVAGVDPGQVVIEHGEFRDSVACAASLIPRQQPGRPSWAVVLSARNEDLPPQACQELAMAARDLTGLR